ncbi:MAG: glycosyltransferase [Polyangiaceae bacterium]|nr:glycosyltransferase [Polyangiaceae bacterium]
MTDSTATPSPGPVRLNLGCGPDIRSGYLNLDFNENPGVAMVCDIRHLPFDDSSVDEVLANDVLEHFPFAETLDVLREWRRVLRVDGRISLRVPNLEGLVELYRTRPYGWRREDAKLVDPIVERLFGGQDFQGNCHYTTFDRTSLWQALEQAGFFVLEITDDDQDCSNIVASALARPLQATDTTSSSTEDEAQNAPEGSDLRVTWQSPCLGISGYAFAAREYITGLADLGVRVSVKPIWGDCRLELDERSADTQQTEVGRKDGLAARVVIDGETRDVVIHTPVDVASARRIAELSTKPVGGVHVLHHPPASPEGVDFTAMFRRVHPGMTAYVAYTTFETDRVPENWVAPLNQMDEVWVPCRFNVDTFARAGVAKEKLHVIPHGFDPERYRPSATQPLEYAREAGFVFLSVFEWTKRKGWDVLLRAYVEEFDKEEDVCLLIRTYQGGGVIDKNRPSIKEQFADYIKELGRDPDRLPAVQFIDEAIPDSQMTRLYKTGDAFVLPTRGEGWGIPLCESMLMEVPVISTRWGGPLEFMSDDNSYLIDVKRLEPVSDEQVRDNAAYEGHRWAEPSLAHTRALMRHVFEHREEAAEKGRRGRLHVLANFAKARTASAIAERLSVLERRVSPVERSERPRVLFQGRGRAFVLPGGDTEVMVRLKVELERQGIRVDFSQNNEDELRDYSLVHIFNYDESQALNAAKQCKPFVITPMHEDTGRYLRRSIETVYAFKHFLADGDRGRLEARLSSIAKLPQEVTTHPMNFGYSAADAILVSGREEARKLKETFPELSPVVDVPLGFTRPKDAAAIGPEPFAEAFGVRDFVLCVGRLESRKNQLMLLYALRDDDVPLVLVNTPTHQPEYEAMCSMMKRRGRTITTGRISEEMLLSAYAAAKVHALPSWYELPGLVTLEAAWQGCNVVASDWGTIRDYLGDSILYCDPGDPDSVRRAVMKALQRPKTTSLRGRVDAFTWRREADRVAQVYEETMLATRTKEKQERLKQLSEKAETMIHRLGQRGEALGLAESEPSRAIGLLEAVYAREDTGINVALGTAHLMLGHLEQTELYLTRALASNPYVNPRHYLYLCLALQRLGKPRELVAVASQCLVVHPFLPEETRNLVREYWRNGQLASGVSPRHAT